MNDKRARNRKREDELLKVLEGYKGHEVPVLVAELLTLRRERHRDKLEVAEDPAKRGRALECKDLLNILC